MRRRSTSNSLAASSIDRIPLCHSRVMKFAHKSPNDFVLREYLPPELKGTKLYESARNKREVEGEKLQQRRWQQEQQQQ